MFQRTTAINKILALKKRIKGIQGGTSAGKTYGILPVLINIACSESNVLISVCSESLPHLKRGAMKDFIDIMKATNRWSDIGFQKSFPISYTFKNGSKIEFFSAGDASTLRGARRDYLYINECNNVRLEAYNELVSRTKQDTYLDWNPVNQFWFHTQLLGDSNVDYLTINYLDNEACPQSAIDFIMQAKAKADSSEYWENWYNVYGLGQIGSLQDVIFQFKACFDIPTDAKLLGYGIDFGFSSDPASCVALYKFNSELYIDEIVYSTNLTNSDLFNRLKEANVDFQSTFICDSAEPKSIEELKRLGLYNAVGASKGRDSVNHSIDLLRTFNLNVTDSSTNLIKEMRSYSWDKNKNGDVLKKPIDKNNHAIDALRYIASDTVTIVPFKYIVI